MKIAEVMTRSLEVIEPEATLADAAARMRRLNVGILPVRDGDRLVGMLTDRDITVRAIADALDPKATRVFEVMTPGVIHCYDDQSVEEAAGIMAQGSVRRLVVLDRAENLVGIVSLDDLAVDREDQQLVGEVLEHVVNQRHIPVRPYGHILVALDGSALGEEVLPYVTVPAVAGGSKVTLLTALTSVDGMYVREYPASVTATTGVPHPLPHTGGKREEAIEYLKGVKDQLSELGIDVDYEYAEGRRAAEVIVSRARHLGVDLIAMTSHGRGRVKHGVFGGVAEDVLRTAPCGVLLIKARGA